MQNFRNLVVWQKSHELTLAVYRATGTFPKDELFGLTSQVRRASASIPANIAEGCGRNSDNEFTRFLQIAMGSATELDYHLILAHDLHYLSEGVYTHLTSRLDEVMRMLNALIQKVKSE